MVVSSPLVPIYPLSKVVVVVLTIKVRIMTYIVPPGSVVHMSTVVGVGSIVVPVSGGERQTVMCTQGIT